MIDESQLKSWASAPSPTEMARIKKTREIIEDVLRRRLPVDEIKKAWSMSSFHYEVYLQGSYANSTNVRFDSDVDIVVQLNAVFSYNTSRIGKLEKLSHEVAYPSNSLYQFNQFKTHIHQALVTEFGASQAHWADKCLNVDGNSSRVDADVVPCFQHKVYKRFVSQNDQNFVEGMSFYNSATNLKIINFPKVHLHNCESKNIDTSVKFKDTVRIFKNMRNNLVESGHLLEETAPSYFIENLLYNCTSPCFDGSYSQIMANTLEYILNAIQTGRISSFICANEQDNLFSSTSWNLQDMIQFVQKMVDYYSEKIKV